MCIYHLQGDSHSFLNNCALPFHHFLGRRRLFHGHQYFRSYGSTERSSHIGVKNNVSSYLCSRIALSIVFEDRTVGFLQELPAAQRAEEYPFLFIELRHHCGIFFLKSSAMPPVELLTQSLKHLFQFLPEIFPLLRAMYFCQFSDSHTEGGFRRLRSYGRSLLDGIGEISGAEGSLVACEDRFECIIDRSVAPELVSKSLPHTVVLLSFG